MAYGLGEVVYPNIMRFPVFQLPHITFFVSGSYDSGFFVRTTHVSSKGLRRPLWGFLIISKQTKVHIVMDKKNLVKLGLAVVLITAGAVLKNSALKSMGSKLIK